MYFYLTLILFSLYIPQLNLMSSIKIVDLIAITMCILWVSHIILFNLKINSITLVNKIYGTLILGILSTIIFHIENMLILMRWVCLLIIPLVYLVHKPNNFLQMRESLQKIILSYLIIALAVSVTQKYLGFFYFRDGSIDWGQLNRSTGFMGNSAQFGMSSFLLYVLYVFTYRPKSNLQLICFFAALGCVLVSGTRTALGFLLVYQSVLIFGLRSLIVLLITPVALYMITKFELAKDFVVTNITILTYFIELRFSNIEIWSEAQEGYCFAIDGNPYLDKSLGLRIEKALFVIKNTFIGQNYFGIGFGNCIGNSSDSLYFRLLNDGGLPLFLGFLYLIINMRRYSPIQNWSLSLSMFLLSSLFFDTLYFQIMCLCWGLLIAMAEMQLREKLKGL